MTAPDHDGVAEPVVHLDLPDDLGGPALRERLGPVLRRDVLDVRVHVSPAADLDDDVLRSLRGAAELLERRGGELVVEGAQDRLRTRLWLHGLVRPLPDPAADPATAHPARPE